MSLNMKEIQENIEPFENTNRVFAEELLIPKLDACDGVRIQMFTNHLFQSKTLIHSEFPNVFTGYENRVGEYSTAYRKSDREWQIVGIAEKNQFTKTYILLDKENNVDILQTKFAERLTERYGYAYKNFIDSKNIGDVIEPDELMYANTAYDENNNFCYGVNLKACFLSYLNLTFEDACVISESAAKKFDAYTPDEVLISINNNDILLNLFGDGETYKCFPDIGEHVDSQIIAGRRRLANKSLLFALQDSQLSKLNVDSESDAAFYIGADKDTMVYDIDVYINGDIEELEELKPYKQIMKYYHNNMNYYHNLIEILKPYIESEEYKCSNDVKFYYQDALKFIDPERAFENDNVVFNNIILKLKTIGIKCVSQGSKLTGRYGSKGVVSAIVPDDQMPINQYGERADICLNPTGVIGRLNLAQLYEQELNFIADNVIREAKKVKDIEKRFLYIIKFYDIVNKTQSKFLQSKWQKFTKKEKENYFTDIYNTGLYIHEPPFFGNTKFEDFRKLFKEFPFEHYSCKINDNNIESKLCIGNIYYMCLKHDSISKFSARCSGELGINNTPSKTKNYKYHTSLFSRNAVRCGEMEVNELLLTRDAKSVIKYLQQNSSSPDNRIRFIKYLVEGNAFTNNMELSSVKTITSQIIETELLAIGIKIKK